MRFSPFVDRIAGKGAAAWSIHFDALRQREAGREVFLLTIGEPDQPPPQAIIAATVEALNRHHTGYVADPRLSGAARRDRRAVR